VLDFRRTAGLDLLAVIAEHAEAADALLPMLAATLEMRAGIGVDLARLCALRSDAGVRGELLEIAEQIAGVAEGVELLALDESFWRGVLDGAGNLAYQLAFNSLIRAVHARHELSLPWLEQELARSDYRRPIAAAIAAGDAESAAAATRAALTPPKGHPLIASHPPPKRRGKR
jgi:DNA-binding FadR family transcriptional regulator